MAAAVTLSPSEVQVGDKVVITATGFLPDTVLEFSIPEYGITAEIMSDKGGDASGVDLADKGATTLTSSGVQVTATDTVTLGTVTYTFRANAGALAAPYDVVMGADAAGSLANLKKAINATGVAGTTYFAGTLAHPIVTAGALTATTLKIFAKVGGTAGNIGSSVAAVTLSFTGANLAGGAVASGLDVLAFSPEKEGPFTVNVTDGTSKASVRCLVFSS